MRRPKISAPFRIRFGASRVLKGLGFGLTNGQGFMGLEF